MLLKKNMRNLAQLNVTRYSCELETFKQSTRRKQIRRDNLRFHYLSIFGESACLQS